MNKFNKINVDIQFINNYMKVNSWILRHMMFQTVSWLCEIIYWMLFEILWIDGFRNIMNLVLRNLVQTPQQALMSFTYRHEERISRCKIYGLTILNSILVTFRNNTAFEISFSCISKAKQKIWVIYDLDLYNIYQYRTVINLDVA